MVDFITGGRTTTREMRMRRDAEAHERDGTVHVFLEQIGQAFREDKELRNKISVRRLFEQFVPDGREIVESWNPEYQGHGALRMPSTDLMEAGSAVTSAMFSAINGQIVYSELLDAFDDPAFVFTDIVRSIPTKYQGERIPGIGRMGNVSEVIPEGNAPPRAGVSADWRDTPITEERGLMIDLTRRAIFFDRTNLLVEQAREIGFWLGYNKEIRLIDAFIDENTTAHRYNWKNTVYASYQTSTPWDNVTASNALVDWTDIDNARQTLGAIRDPNTGAPIVNVGKDIVVVDALLWTANRIVSATEIEVATPGYAVSTNPTVTKVRNPVQNARIVSSQLLADRLATDTDWFYGDIEKAIEYRENFPLNVEQAPMGAGEMWERGIAISWKATEMGAATVRNPRYVTKSTA